MSKRNRIHESWLSYTRKVIPQTAGEVQRRECQRAFYAGAATMFKAIMDVDVDGPEEAALAEMDLLQSECLDFALGEDDRVSH